MTKAVLEKIHHQEVDINDFVNDEKLHRGKTILSESKLGTESETSETGAGQNLSTQYDKYG